MKNSTLLFRSLAIIIFITGGAHLATYASQSTNFEKNSTEEVVEENTTLEEEYESNQSSEIVPENYYENKDFIIGKWNVTYNSKDFKGAITYNIKKEGKEYNAYTYQYQDDEGNAEKAEGSKALVIKKFDGYKGKGIYKIEYEGKQYDVKCDINMVDENTFKLSYDYYGYDDVETWKRQ